MREPIGFRARQQVSGIEHALPVVMTGVFKPLASMIVMLSLMSCAFREDTEEIRYLKAKQDVENGLEKITFKRAEINTEFIPGSRLNEYSAKLSWPKGRPVHVRISQNDQVVDTFERDAENSIVVQCVDRFLNVKIETMIEGSEITSTHEIEQACPTDYRVEANSVLSDLPTGLNGRLFFAAGGILSLREADILNLRVASIEVESGVGRIRVLSEDNKTKITAELHNNGLPQVEIRAERATGALRFELNGIDGSDGGALSKEDGGEIAADPAKNGAPGRDAVVDLEADCKRIGPRGDPTLSCKPKCVSPPTSGQPGRDGVASTARGKIGNAGIGTSPVSLLIDQPKDFRVTFAFNPGRGGNGGPGGEGQPGGQPGAPGANPYSICAPAPAAAPGKAGSRGPIGFQGPDGGCGRLTLSRELQGSVELVDKRSECSKTTNLIRFVD